LSAKLISIIGPPAAGKTTLARALCADLGARLIREDWDGNPFLAKSYDGDAQWRLPGQLYFLESRLGQLAQATWPVDGLAVSDYGFCQDRIFARQRLTTAEFDLYERLANRLDPLVHPPDVVVHLDASAGLLMERIAARGRQFERVMDEGFLASMREAYNQAAATLICPVVRVDCDRTDLRIDAARRELIRQASDALRL